MNNWNKDFAHQFLEGDQWNEDYKALPEKLQVEAITEFISDMQQESGII